MTGQCLHDWTEWGRAGPGAWRRDCVICGEFERRLTRPSPEDWLGSASDQTGTARDKAAEARDLRARGRDEFARARDAAADARDRASMSGHYFEDRGWEEPENGSALPPGPVASDALGTVSDRTKSSWDRKESLNDRVEAAGDRSAASDDRWASASDRVAASLDELTGAYRRGAGFVELEREAARARRTGQSLVLAFVDVNGLKAINDSRGHTAGDRLLRQVVVTLRAQLRSYDLVIRFGGDEFLCAIPGVTMDEAAERLATVNAALAASPDHGSVTTGLAELQPDDSLQDLVARADSSLYQLRQQGSQIDLTASERMT